MRKSSEGEGRKDEIGESESGLRRLLETVVTVRDERSGIRARRDSKTEETVVSFGTERTVVGGRPSPGNVDTRTLTRWPILYLKEDVLKGVAVDEDGDEDER